MAVMSLGVSRIAIEAIGYAAGALTTLAFVPQVVKSWRSGSTRDLSFAMLVAFTSGVSLWLVYGVALGSLPIVLANGVTLALTGALFVLKLREASRASVSRFEPATAGSQRPDS